VSDPARPESAGHAALRELAAVIRNVTEQLAGFRRRALAAESRARELEHAAVAAEQASRAQLALTAQVESLVAQASGQAQRIEALERELREALLHRARVAELERALAEAQQASEDVLTKVLAPAVVTSAAGGATTSAMEAENVALRERLGEAVERTRVIGERVRFLRQQLGNGGDK